jgi:hypothetical protein
MQYVHHRRVIDFSAEAKWCSCKEMSWSRAICHG